MTEKPLLTIFVTAYNSGKTIKKTLDSLVSQTYPNFEIIVSDNESSDNTLKIVESFHDSMVSIRKNVKKITTNKSYIGFYDNCNGCLESRMAKGEFVSIYHADDIYEKDIAAKEIEFLTNNPNAGAVFSMGKIIDQHDNIIGAHKLPKELKGKNIYGFDEVFKNILQYGNTFLLTPTFMARKSVFNAVGLFANEGQFGTSADLDMWLRILQKYNIGILHQDLVRRREHGQGNSYNSLRTQTADFFKVMDHYLIAEGYIAMTDKKDLRQYAYQKDFDNTLRAMNFLIKNELSEAKKIINSSFSWELFRAFFENMSVLRVKVLALKIILFVGINLGFGKYLGKILYKAV